MIYRGMILRFLALSEKSYINYKSSMKQFCNKDLRDNRNISEEKAAEYKNRFEHCIDLVKSVFGDKAFRRYIPGDENESGKWTTNQINMALFDLQMVGFVNYSKNEVLANADAIREGLLDLMTMDTKFQELIGFKTSDTDNVKKRFKIYMDLLEKAIGDRLRDPKDRLKMVIVRDMWLTGFDAPCLHTLYIDKPMKGHNLMQAIARVNRVYKDKEGGLVVDYIGIATDLKKALYVYTESGGKGKPTFDQEEAATLMMEKYEIVAQMFSEKPVNESLPNGFNYQAFFELTPKEKLYFPIKAANYILGLENGKERYINAVTALSKAFAISVPHPSTIKIRDEVGLFQAIKSRIVKVTQSRQVKSDEEIETAIKQILSDAIISDEVIDVFDAAGIKKPDISILSDDFLAEVKGMQHRNVALELLKKLLNDEIKVRKQSNLVQSRKFSEMLDQAVKRYQNNLITSAEIIEELIRLAREINAADRKGEALGLDFRELAFYSALETNDNAVAVLGDEVLRHIARELVDTVKQNTSIDWTVRENVQAKMRIAVKKILRKHGYPPNLEKKATETVLEQAKLLAGELNN